MSKKIEGIIFDWAGTTVDFGSFAPVQAFIDGFKKFGIEPTLEEVRKPMGILKWNHIDTMMKMPRIATEWENLYGKAATKKDVDAVYKESEAALLTILENFAEPKPFVLETIKELRDMGIKIGSTTGYTDEMMSILVPKAKGKGYAPDFYCTPEAANNMGRPYPYMIFKNIEALGLDKVNAVIKVGDTVADIAEGKNAGLISIGVMEGSSVMGLSEAEFNALSEAERNAEYLRVEKIYMNCGADYVIKNMSEMVSIVKNIEAQ